MNRKNCLVIVLLLSFFSLYSSAQDASTEARKAKLQQQKKEYYSLLNLNESQQKEMDKIQIEFLEEAEKLKQSNQSRFRKGQQLKSLQKRKDSRVKKILSPEQFLIYKQEQERRKTEWKQNRNN